VIVPRYPGVASALGLLLSDVRHDLRQTWVQATGSLRLNEFKERLAVLEDQARGRLAGAGASDDGGRVSFELDMRYRGQAYELTVPLASSAVDDEALQAVERDFHAAHEQTYGYDSPIEEIEIVTLRAHATTPIPSPEWNAPDVRRDGPPRARADRRIWTPGRGAEHYAVYERESLAEGSSLEGPAIIEQDDSTIVVEPDWRLVTGAAESAILEQSG
jgi:N-methylhydantoinase A